MRTKLDPLIISYVGLTLLDLTGLQQDRTIARFPTSRPDVKPPTSLKAGIGGILVALVYLQRETGMIEHVARQKVPMAADIPARQL